MMSTDNGKGVDERMLEEEEEQEAFETEHHRHGDVCDVRFLLESNISHKIRSRTTSTSKVIYIFPAFNVRNASLVARG